MSRSTRPLVAHRAVALAAVVGLGAASLPAAAAFDSLQVFGDSLSDSGNLNALTGYPPAPYFFGRFSNGPVAAEYLAAGLGLGAAQFFDHAYGGATTGLDGEIPGTGLLSQVNTFASALGAGSADSHALYMVWAGANDFLHAPPGQTVDVTIGNAVTNLATAVSTLHAKGATQFLLPLMPDLGVTPRALTLDIVAPGTAAGLSYVSSLFNTTLLNAYGGLATNWSDEHFYVFDTFAAQHTTLAAAKAAGKNTTDACYIEGVTPLCAGYGLNYYYFDDIHPTTATHQALAAGMLAAVPEPATMLMMAAGVMVLLGVSRRRDRSASPA
jgi:phospholipase/lecithinase/hemolysin